MKHGKKYALSAIAKKKEWRTANTDLKKLRLL
jgi:hypothetical protein